MLYRTRLSFDLTVLWLISCSLDLYINIAVAEHDAAIRRRAKPAGKRCTDGRHYGGVISTAGRVEGIQGGCGAVFRTCLDAYRDPCFAGNSTRLCFFDCFTALHLPLETSFIYSLSGTDFKRGVLRVL